MNKVIYDELFTINIQKLLGDKLKNTFGDFELIKISVYEPEKDPREQLKNIFQFYINTTQGKYTVLYKPSLIKYFQEKYSFFQERNNFILNLDIKEEHKNYFVNYIKEEEYISEIFKIYKSYLYFIKETDDFIIFQFTNANKFADNITKYKNTLYNEYSKYSFIYPGMNLYHQKVINNKLYKNDLYDFTITPTNSLFLYNTDYVFDNHLNLNKLLQEEYKLYYSTEESFEITGFEYTTISVDTKVKQINSIFKNIL